MSASGGGLILFASLLWFDRSRSDGWLRCRFRFRRGFGYRLRGGFWCWLGCGLGFRCRFRPVQRSQLKQLQSEAAALAAQLLSWVCGSLTSSHQQQPPGLTKLLQLPDDQRQHRHAQQQAEQPGAAVER